MKDETSETMTLRSDRNWLKVKRIDAQGLYWLVIGGTTAAPGDIVRFPGLNLGAWEGGAAPRLSPFLAETVLDSVTGEVILPESGRAAHRLRQAMKLVRRLEAADLSDAAQRVRDWLRPTLMEDFRDRIAA